MQKIFSRLITQKINPKWIVKNHLDTLVDGKGRMHRPDYITFFLLPVIPAIIFKTLGAALDKDMVDIINTGLALFAGLFLSVSIQLIAIDKVKLTSESSKTVQKQAISNIAFLVLLSLVTIIVSYFSLFQGVDSRRKVVLNEA